MRPLFLITSYIFCITGINGTLAEKSSNINTFTISYTISRFSLKHYNFYVSKNIFSNTHTSLRTQAKRIHERNRITIRIRKAVKRDCIRNRTS